jgi:hypothetical protein
MSFGFPSVGGRCCTAASIHIARKEDKRLDQLTMFRE